MKWKLALCILGVAGAWLCCLDQARRYDSNLTTLNLRLDALDKQTMKRPFIEAIAHGADGTDTITRTFVDEYVSIGDAWRAHAEAIKSGGKVKCAMWTSGGVSHSVKTPRLNSESKDDWCARHDATVAEGKAQFPPDGH